MLHESVLFRKAAGEIIGTHALRSIDHRPSLLIAASSDAFPELKAMATGAGLRPVAPTEVGALAERLGYLVGVDVLLVDLRSMRIDDQQLYMVLRALLTWPGWHDARPLFLVELDTAETVAAMLDIPFDRLLCTPTRSDIGLALCLAVRGTAVSQELHDTRRESGDAWLEQLSAQVRQLAQTIDRLAQESRDKECSVLQGRDCNDGLSFKAYADEGFDGDSSLETSPPSAAELQEVRALLQARRLRDRFMPCDLFADPAWDMMLDLMAARLDGKRVSVSSLCIAAAVPPTTALRWIAQLTERGIFVRRNDPDDARRVFISLSDEAAEGLANWFSAVRSGGLRFAG